VSHDDNDEYDDYDHYEPEPDELLGPYEYLLDELDEPLRELVGGLERDEDYDADFDGEGRLDGIYTTIRLSATTEVRDQLLERVEDLAEAARSAGVHQLLLLVTSVETHDIFAASNTVDAPTVEQVAESEVDLDAVRGAAEREKATLMDVATWKVSISEADEGYKQRRQELRDQLSRAGLPDPNKWRDLMEWWDEVNHRFTSYRERRAFVRDSYRELDNALESPRRRSVGIDLADIHTSWGRLDEQVAQLGPRLAAASTPEDFKAIGHLCREVFLTLGRVLFDESRHLRMDEDSLQRDNAKDRIDRVIATELSGGEKERLRKMVRATWDYVQEVIHAAKSEREAQAAALSTQHVVATLKILLGDDIAGGGTLEP
jgi:hypothetical protein